MLKSRKLFCGMLFFLLLRAGSVYAQYDTVRVPLLNYLLQQYDTVLAYVPFTVGRLTPDYHQKYFLFMQRRLMKENARAIPSGKRLFCFLIYFAECF